MYVPHLMTGGSADKAGYHTIAHLVISWLALLLYRTVLSKGTLKLVYISGDLF